MDFVVTTCVQLKDIFCSVKDSTQIAASCALSRMVMITVG